MNTITLKYVNKTFMSGDRLYKDTKEIYFSKDDYGNVIYIGTDPDADPWGNVENIKEYKNVKFIFIGDENLPTEEERFNYMLLSRLKTDCDYYLNNGNRYTGCLWAENEIKQIGKMKELYNSFTDNEKPEWLTLNDILNYEKEMVQ